MNRRQKKKCEQSRLRNITAYVKDRLEADRMVKRDPDPVVNTARRLTERRKRCQTNGWKVRAK